MVELDALTQLRGLTTAQAAAFVGEHVETFTRKVRNGQRPPPDRVFGPRKRYWTVETLLRAAGKNAAGKAPVALDRLVRPDGGGQDERHERDSPRAAAAQCRVGRRDARGAATNAADDAH